MNLYDLLRVLPTKDYIIITDFERKPDKCRSNRMKIGNISMDKLRNIGSKDVYSFGWSESQKCFYVNIGDKRYVKTELAVWHVVDTRLRQLGLMERVRRGIANETERHSAPPPDRAGCNTSGAAGESKLYSSEIGN